MVKSYVRELLNVYRALFADAKYAYPALECEFDRDQARIQSIAEEQGIHVFVVALPALGKHLDRCLSERKYVPSGLPHSAAYRKGVVIPKLFRELYLLIFDDDGSLKEECDVQALMLLRQFLYLAKKCELRCSSDNEIREIREFIAVDQSLPQPKPFWQGSSVGPRDVFDAFGGFSESSDIYGRLLDVSSGWEARRTTRVIHLLRVLDEVSSILSTTLGAFRPQEWDFKHGPGVVSDLKKSQSKYIFDNWTDRLESVFPFADFAFANFGIWISHLCKFRSKPASEPYSKLISVPKTYLKPRLIAAEPHEHMWCQQSVKHFMYTRVERSFIGSFVRFTDQTLNQELCKMGSSTGDLITVDLSAASDRVTCEVVGQFFRANPSVLLALQATRTKVLVQEIAKTLPSVIELRKYSTMGNATTFPVETLVFLGIVIASVLTVRGLRPSIKNIQALAGEVAVFGDDIIAPKDSRELLYDALDLLWFKVNDSKSYTEGNFRESCGVDSYAGQNITPAFWKAPYDRSPEGYCKTVMCSNNFYKKFYVHTANYLKSTMGRRHTTPLVSYHSGQVGWSSFVEPDLSELKTRWNSDIQQKEVLVTVPIGAQSKSPLNHYASLLQFFVEEPDPMTSWSSGVPKRPRLRLKKRWVPAEVFAT